MRVSPKPIAVLAAIMCLAALPAQSKETADSVQTTSSVEIRRNVSYLEPGRAETLDVYLPRNRDKAVRSPAIVMIHGGGWVGGSKSAPREKGMGNAFAQAGFVAVSVEYMKEEGKRWPTNLMDCKNAVRWLRVNAEKLQVDPEHVGVIGGSAGGHLALMVAYTSGVAELTPEELYPGVPDHVSACVDLYGITNLVTRQSTFKDGKPNGQLRGASALFPQSREEAPELWKLVSPVSYIGPATPPTLIYHGTADTTVDRDQSKELAEKLDAAGVEHRLEMIQGAPHSFTLNDKRLPKDLTPEVVEFFRKHPGAGKPKDM